LSLILQSSANLPSMLSGTRLHSLLEFTIAGGTGMIARIATTPQENQNRNVQPIFPSVQYLHIPGGPTLGLFLATNAPSLIHLRLSEVDKLPADQAAAFESLLQQLPDSPFSTTVETILLQPTNPAVTVTPMRRFTGVLPSGRNDRHWIDRCRDLDKGNRLVLLMPD